MKNFLKIAGGLFVLIGFIAVLNLLHAQETTVTYQGSAVSLTDTNVDWNSMSDLQVMLTAIESVPAMPSGSLPDAGTFWSAQHAPGSAEEWPPLPTSFGMGGWSLGDDGVYLLNDLNHVYPVPNNLTSARITSSGGLMTMDTVDINPADGTNDSGSTNGDTGGGYSPQYLPGGEFGTNLWVEITNLTGGVAGLMVSNTVADVEYEVQSRADLIQSNWNSEGFFFGSEITNWTATSAEATNYPNLFYRIRSWQDSDGSGLPDWWQLKYFGTTGVDPYGDPDGDGWNNLQEFQNGTDPTVFNTPPAPSGVYVYMDSTGTTNLISWNPAQGSPTDYIVYRGVWDDDTGNFNYTQIGTVSASTTSFEDTGVDNDDNIYAYEVQASYAGGYSSVSGDFYVNSSPYVPTPDIHVAATLVRDATGRWQLVFSSLPAGVKTIRLFVYPYYWDYDYYDYYSQDVSVTNINNGIYQIPDADALNYTNVAIGVAGLATNGVPGPVAQAGVAPDDAPYFVDGRQHMKQNLTFLIRAASIYQPFGGTIYSPYDGYSGRLNLSATNFEEFSFLHHDSDYYGNALVALDNLWPFTANYRLADYFVNTNLTNGSASSFYQTTNFNFQPDFNTNMPAQPILTHSDPFWIFQPGFSATWGYPAYNTSSTTNWGVSMSSTQTVANLQSGIHNLFGQPYETGCMIDYSLSYTSGGAILIDPNTGYPYWYAIYQPLDTGDTITAEYATNHFSFVAYASQCPAPTLQFVNYYFTPLLNPNLNAMILPPVNQQPPSPLDDNFNPTNETPSAIIGAVGQPMIVGAWAKYSISNSSPTKYAYLGQYFTNAFQVDANGTVTTNKAGVLSPYGEFFPTNVGKVALVTMPDIDTGAQGTCTVYCVSMNVDANHDGVMDLNFNSADATSSGSPMVAWVNNGYILPGTGVNLDEDEPLPLNNPNNANAAYGQITCQRDLENFFRLWICGLPSALSNQNYYVTLTCTAISGSPAINLYYAETNGGIGYLTDTNVAASLVGEYKLATISPTSPVALPFWFFNGSDLHFMFEGAGVGEGQFTLTIFQGTNAIAQTSTYIDLHDIKDFYERAVIAENTSGTISNWSSSIETVQQQTTAISDEDSNIIVFVHGFNVDNWHWLDDSDTVLKRLYWAGYQGKFMSVHWPGITLSFWNLLNSEFMIFNDSEIRAYKASAALKDYLSGLSTRFPNYRLNIYAHSQGNAVVGEAIKRGAPFDTYILSQGAMPDSAYDAGAPTDSGLIAVENTYGPTPENAPWGYRGIYTNFTGRIVNFYNANDPVLAFWQSDQGAAKPNLPITSYTWNGTNGIYDVVFGSYVVTDPEESLAYISRSRTLSIGQSPPETTHGVIQSGIDLNADFGFGRKFPDDHSAQWVWPIQTTRSYYIQILMIGPP